MFDGIQIRGFTNKSACDLRIVRTRWSDRSFDRIGEDLRSLSLPVSSLSSAWMGLRRRKNIRFGDKSLHAQLAECPKHQESVFHKQFFRGDRSSHGIQASLSLLGSFNRWWTLSIGYIKCFTVWDMDWDCWFSELGRGAILSNISGKGRNIVIWIGGRERVAMD